MTKSGSRSIFVSIMRKRFLNKAFLCLAAAVGLLAGCSKPEDGSVLYCIEVRDNGSEEYFGSSASAVKPLSLEIGDELGSFSSKWSKTWTGDISDRSGAIERYGNALSEFKKIESDYKSKLKALPAGLHDSFSYKKTLVLTSSEEIGGEEVLKSYRLTLAYPAQ